MQEVQTFRRCLLPPGRATTCTVCTFGSHRRLVRRWECDTDLPKPGPFPQMSHTAAIVLAPQISGVRLGGLPRGPGQPGLIRAQSGYRLSRQPPKRSPSTSPLVARLNEPVQPAVAHWWSREAVGRVAELRWRPPEAITTRRRGGSD